MKPTAILASVLAVLAIAGSGCIQQQQPIIYRPMPSPDSGDGPAPVAAARPAGHAHPGPEDFPASGFEEPAAPAAPAAPARLAVPTEWREVTGAGGASYEIQSADTLSEIAMHRLETMHNLPLLMLANRRIARPEMVRRGETITIPGPAYFAAPFLKAGEGASAQKLLRYAESSREGFVGVSLPGAAGERFLALEVKDGKSRVVFDAAGLLPRAPAGGKEVAWSWRALDLDDDGGLDLVCSRQLEAGGVLQGCVFQSTGRGYRRHILTESALSGEFDGRRVSYRERTLTIRGGAPGEEGAGALRYRWVGDKFEVTKE